jgi:hypothetical protein
MKIIITYFIVAMNAIHGKMNFGQQMMIDYREYLLVCGGYPCVYIIPG